MDDRVDEQVDEPETAADESTATGGWGEAVLAELAGLRGQVARDHDRAAAREQIIDRLHADNQSLRSGERRLLLLPLLTDLQRLRHELLRDAGGLPEQFSGSQAAALLRSYAYNLELALERGGIAVVVPEPGAAFDPSAHRATGTVPIDDPGLAGSVAAVMVDGYRDAESGRIVTPAEVRVHRWTEAAPPPEAEPATETADLPS